MCGLGGIIRVTPAGREREPIPERAPDRLEALLAWRGPDGRGRHCDVAGRPDGSTIEIVLVHTRLAILDLPGGAQPMVSARGPDGSGPVGVVFNGCIYNHADLRRELETYAHAFQSHHSDTEVLLHAWRQWGAGLADRLDGMYAAAIWDRERGTCVLLRDRAGEKPLYYASPDGGQTLVFASTIPALQGAMRELEADAPELDPSVITEWVCFGWSDRPPIKGIREVAPRETLAFPARAGYPIAGDVVERLHRVELPPMRRAEASLDPDAVERLLRDSIIGRTQADVPLGCFLSGGVDSSLVALYAQERVERLTTLCVRFSGAGYDESPFAAEVARRLGTDHVTIEVNPLLSDTMVGLIGHLGLPFGDSSLLAAHAVSTAARDHVKVVLTGDGGDELFFGYRRHKAALMLRRLWPVVRMAPEGVLWAVSRGERPIARIARFVATTRALGYQPTMPWRLPDLAELLPSEAPGLRRPIGPPPDPAIEDFRGYLPFDLLRKGDTASMAAGLEARAPMLSNDLIVAAQAAPIASLMVGGRLKGVLRDLLRRRLPDALVDRPKHGFAIPVGEYMRDGFGGMRTLVADRLAGPTPFGPVHDVMDVNVGLVHAIVDQHLSGQRDHGARLYHLLALAIWSTGLSA